MDEEVLRQRLKEANETLRLLVDSDYEIELEDNEGLYPYLVAYKNVRL